MVGLEARRRTRPLMTMHSTSNTVHISDWRKAVLVSPAEMNVATREMPTSSSAGKYQKVPRISRVSRRARRLRRVESGWLRIRWAMGRRKRRMNTAVDNAASTLAKVAVVWARCSPSEAPRRGSFMASPKAAKLPISHSGWKAW
ncbi:hypothetical protein D3C80_1108650 [compost metagenome]